MFCGNKEKRIIIFKKISTFLILLSLTFLNLNLTKEQNFYFYLKGTNNVIEFFQNMDCIWEWSQASSIFFLIVNVVVWVVLSYREIYIEGYNVKKFFYVTISFYLVICILTLRASHLVLIRGWDWLGITSIFLIIFYPNKTSIINSRLTIYYNRLGDLLLIVALIILISMGQLIWISLNYNLWVAIIFTACLITKRAQFPISSWLPAAMRAPTPISAIVHSSTLVTAGIYLITKILNLVSLSGLSESIVGIFSIRFILGGLIAIKEYDLKKMVAFSTIRQIRIILLIITKFNILLGIVHIVIHAIFKTRIFCWIGIVFLSNVDNQDWQKMKIGGCSKIKSIIILIRLLRIVGLHYSSRFYTKHELIEILINKSGKTFLLIFLIGATLTIFYSLKIISSTKSSNSEINVIKISRVIRVQIYSLIFLSFIFVFYLPIIFRSYEVITRIDRFLVILVLTTALIIYDKKLNKNLVTIKIIGFINWIILRKWKNLLNNLSLKILSSSDIKTINTNYLFLKINKTNGKINRGYWVLLLFIILII